MQEDSSAKVIASYDVDGGYRPKYSMTNFSLQDFKVEDGVVHITGSVIQFNHQTNRRTTLKDIEETVALEA